MRAMRTGMMAVVVLALLACSSIGVDAQDPDDPMAPAYFTYTVEVVEESPRGNPMVLRDHQQVVAVEATDPRASGLMTTTYNWNTVVLDDEWKVITTAESERLTNEGGTWTGTGRGVLTGGEVLMMTGMDVLTGEGGYEGLTLVMGQFMRANVADTNWGFILPSDQVPPMPELSGLEVDEELAPFPTKDVVVATQAIEKGTAIGPEAVSLRNVPIDETNRHTFADLGEVVGRLAAIDILESQMLAPNLLEPPAE